MRAEQKATHVLDNLNGDYIFTTGTPVALAETLEAIGWALIGVVEELTQIRVALVEGSGQ